MIDKELQEQSNFLVFSLAEASRKLHDIAWPIMISNTDICPNSKINAFGLMMSHSKELPLSLEASFYAASPISPLFNNTSSLPMIVSVANNSPAHKANIMEGDLIISINNNLVSHKNYKNIWSGKC